MRGEEGKGRGGGWPSCKDAEQQWQEGEKVGAGRGEGMGNKAPWVWLAQEGMG